MCVNPGEDIGLEVHEGIDQVLFFLEGHGESVLGEHRGLVAPGDVAVVPAGTWHNFVNTGGAPMKLYTVYAPPEHAPGTVHLTKAEAEAAEAAEHGHAAGVPMSAPLTPSSAPVAARRAPEGLTVGGLLGT
jgi:oxalate decarboxylase/phosphoglucose isomerase-like protein (cupin superfamily)